MKRFRHILRIPWTAKRTNEWVLETSNVNRSLLESIKSRKLKYYGHVLRNKEETLEKDIIQGTVPGRRARGRPRMMWMNNIKVWTGLSLAETLRSVENRKQWRRVVHNATNLRNENS